VQSVKVTDVVPSVKAPSIIFVLESVVTSVVPLETPSIPLLNSEYELKEAHQKTAVRNDNNDLVGMAFRDPG
jgi:hypothetical protein